MPSGYEPTREPLLKRTFFGNPARSKREVKVLHYVIGRIREALPRADERVSRQRAQGSEHTKVIPYTAVISDARGIAYASPEPLTFVRQPIEIDRVDGDSVVLSGGPPAGTEVVTARPSTGRRDA